MESNLYFHRQIEYALKQILPLLVYSSFYLVSLKNQLGRDKTSTSSLDPNIRNRFQPTELVQSFILLSSFSIPMVSQLVTSNVNASSKNNTRNQSISHSQFDFCAVKVVVLVSLVYFLVSHFLMFPKDVILKSCKKVEDRIVSVVSSRYHLGKNQ